MKKKNASFLPNIDPKIYTSFGVILFLSLLFLLYQYLRHVDCENANYYIHADEYIVNKVVEFNDNTEGATSWEWDFGDSTEIDRRQRTLHYYKKPGEYIVKLKINGNCVHEKSVTITSISQQTGYLPIIMAPDVATVGDPIYFNAEKEGGESWEWSFGETANTDALGKSPVYRFKTTGDKKITLIVNGDYLCRKYDIPVVANDKKLIPFEQFCQDIAGKKIKITALRLNKDAHNCIQNINIQYKVKKYLIWMKE